MDDELLLAIYERRFSARPRSQTAHTVASRYRNLFSIR
jgi:hypothetical protein